MQLTDIELMDPATYVPAVPHEYFSYLRAEHPVEWREEPGHPGFWAVTTFLGGHHLQRVCDGQP